MLKTYKAFGPGITTGKEGAYLPTGGRITHTHGKEECLFTVSGEETLKTRLSERKEAGLPMPTHYEIHGAGVGRCSHENMLRILKGEHTKPIYPA